MRLESLPWKLQILSYEKSLQKGNIPNFKPSKKIAVNEFVEVNLLKVFNLDPYGGMLSSLLGTLLAAFLKGINYGAKTGSPLMTIY